MSYHAYCICAAIANPRLPFPAGVDGQPVSLIMATDLCVVVSAVSNPVSHAHPDVPRILAFERVVETFHQERPVLPLRYGLVLDNEWQATQMLNRNKAVYISALRELEGCVELGIRIILDGAESEPAPFEAAFDPSPRSVGVRYLAARQYHYLAQDGCPRHARDLMQEIGEAFRGLFVKCGTETALVRHSMFRVPVMSLEFLVERKNVSVFRQTFRMLNKGNQVKMLLSGPWPPYSFVPTRIGGDGC